MKLKLLIKYYSTTYKIFLFPPYVFSIRSVCAGKLWGIGICEGGNQHAIGSKHCVAALLDLRQTNS